MNILITGAFGFVGNNLLQELNSENTHLIAVDINEPENHIFDAYYSWNDLETINFEEIDTIIHLAGKAHDTKNTTEEKAYFEINVGLTQKIFEYFLKSNATKFIYFSSVKAVADSVEGEFLTEEAEAKPQTAYGRSKLEAEKFIERRMREWEMEREGDEATWRKGDGAKKRRSDEAKGRKGDDAKERRGEEEKGREGESAERFLSSFGMTGGKKVYILRPCMIHGPGNKGNLNLLYKLVKKGIPWLLGSFENKRSFCSIANVQFVIQQLIEKDIKPGVYNMADDEAISTNQLIQLISASQNKKARIWNISPKVIRVLARVGDYLHLPLNSERLKKLTESYVVSNSKLKKALGTKKMPIGAEEGMRETVRKMSE